MSDTEYCAREGCGAPRAWHTLAELARWTGRTSGHESADWSGAMKDGWCVGLHCPCMGFVEPEPERKPYVVEMVLSEREVLMPSGALIPLADYLAAHPQPDGPMCVCRHKEDAHDGSGCLYRFCTCVGYNEVQP